MTGQPFLPALLGYSARIAVEAAFGADLSDTAGAGWTWTDITADVRHANRVPVTVGRSDNVSQAGAAAFACALNNGPGNYTPLNPVGSHYPDVARNTPIRQRITLDGVTWYTRFQGYADSWNPRATDASAKVRTVELSAYGMLARLAGRKKPIRSPLSASTAADVSCLGAWSLEDGAGSSAFASLLPGGAPGTFSGDMTLAAVQLAPGAAPTVKFGTSSTLTLPGAVLSGDRFILSWFALIPSTITGSVVLLKVAGSGTVVQWTVSINLTAKTFTTVGTNAAGTNVVNSTITPSNFAELLDVGRNWQLAVVNDGGGAGVARMFLSITATDPFADEFSISGDLQDYTGTIGTRLFDITVPKDADLAGYCFGQVGIFHFVDISHPPGPKVLAIGAWPREKVSDRITRICTEQGIDLDIIGTSDTLMGPQPVGTVLDVLRECEATDHGMLYDGVGPGIAYQCRTSRYNAAAALTLDMGANPPQVAPPFEPTFDKQGVRNLYTVGHGNVAGVTVEKTDGPVGTAAIGVEDAAAQVNVYPDSTLVNHAGLLLALGTVEGFRFATLNLNVRGAASKAAALLAAGGPGYRVTVNNPASKSVDLPPDPIDVIAEGWTETTTADSWAVMFNCSPFAPWVVAEIGSTDHGRIGAVGTSVLNVSISATATTMDVAPGAYPWTTDPADVPLDVGMGGERIRVTNVGLLALGVQTFTITRSINGVVKAQTAGQSIDVWQPAVIGL